MANTPTASVVTLATLCSAVESGLGAAEHVVTSQDYDELSESIWVPTLQVYPETWGEPSRPVTMRGGVVIGDVVIHADVWIGPAGGGSLPSTYALMVILADEINVILNARCDAKFDVEGVKRVTWTAARIPAEYNGEEWVAVQYELSFTIF